MKRRESNRSTDNCISMVGTGRGGSDRENGTIIRIVHGVSSLCHSPKVHFSFRTEIQKLVTIDYRVSLIADSSSAGKKNMGARHGKLLFVNAWISRRNAGGAFLNVFLDVFDLFKGPIRRLSNLR